ncbi:MAG: ABC transporter permease [Acidobacteria bacterium]|nr:ABC transporter permease [Acidobacteriota bacterium]
MLPEWLTTIRFFFTGKNRHEVDEEIQFHVERQIEANLAAGMPLEEARRQAAIAFGGRQRTREQCREQRPSFPMEATLRDLRYGVRGLLRNPGFTFVALITIALAIGANSAVFSLLNQALIRALPVHDPNQLVVVSFAGGHPGHTQSGGGNTPGHAHEFSYPMYRDLRDQNTVFDGLIAAAPVSVGVVWNNRAEAVGAAVVSGNYFETLGVRPAAGRLLQGGDETVEGANPVAVLSFDYWKTHLGEVPVVGRELLINGTAFTIIGVSAPGFRGAVWGQTPAVFVPITMQRVVEPDREFLHDHQSYWLNLVGRLRPGLSSSSAAASLNALFINLRKAEFPNLRDHSERERKDFVDNAHINLDGGAQGFSPMRDQVETPLKIIMGMALLVIAMAVVNVSSLLLVRAATRTREFSMRFALGATNAQVCRQLLAEGFLLGIVGAAIGLAIAPEALKLLIHWMTGPSASQPVFSASIDFRVVLFTMAATLLATLLFSLAPAVQFWNPRLSDFLKQQTGTSVGGMLRFRRTCVALQIGFSLLLIVGAGLFVQTIRNLRNIDPGFETENLLSFNIAPQMAGYAQTAVAPVEQRILDALATIPGIRSAGATNDPELVDDDINGDVIVPGFTPKLAEEFDVELPWISNGYLQTQGVPLVAGRLFSPSDTATSQKVAVVNESFAKHFFGTPQAALGHHMSRPHRPASDAVIVGVVKDVKHVTIRFQAIPTAYTLYTQAEKPTGLTFYVRTWQNPHAAENSIRSAVANIDSRLIVDGLSTLNEDIDNNMMAERTIALLATTFGVLATLLAGIGLYGILAYSTAQRTREIGIRMALGARRATVVGLILREVLTLAAWAIGVSIPIAYLAARAIRSQLFGVSAADPLVYIVAIMVIAIVAATAGLIPSRRAATVDPVRALRID